MCSIEELMGLSDPAMNNQTICLDRGVLRKQKYANEKNSVTTHLTADDEVFWASSVARLAMGLHSFGSQNFVAVAQRQAQALYYQMREDVCY